MKNGVTKITMLLVMIFWIGQPLVQCLNAQEARPMRLYSSVVSETFSSKSQSDSRVPLNKILTYLQQKFNVQFFYKDKALRGKYGPSPEALLKKNPGEALAQLLTALNLGYAKLGATTYVIYPEDTKPLINLSPAIRIQFGVSGKVTDASTGEPLPGVNVLVKGTSTGTATDVNGKYQLDVPNSSDTLLFSYIGYQTLSVPINNRHEVNVKMQVRAVQGQQMVVIGYGSQAAKNVTASVASVTSKNFVQGSVTDAGQLLQGKVAGLTIVNPSGDPNGSTQILLRGHTSILGENANPLVLIDGVQGNMSTVPPEDIQSISVLKGGAAAAIYGSRANNGVILITTKKATGKTEVSYSGYVSTQMIARQPDISTAADFRAQIAAGYRAKNQDHGASTDWLKAVTRTPITQSHNLTISGGNSQSNYMVDLNFKNDQGIFLKSYRQNFSGLADINHSMFNDMLKLNANIYQSSGKFHPFDTNVYRQALQQNPTSPTKNPDGTWYQEVTKFEYDNPLSDVYETHNITNMADSRYKGTITFDPISELEFKGVFAYSKSSQNNGESKTKQNISTLRDSRNGEAWTTNNMWIQRLADLTVEYSKSFGAHNVKILGGYSYQYNYNRYASMYNYNFPTDQFGFSDIQSGQALKEGMASENSNETETNLIAFFARANYNYKDKYLVMASLRREAASQLWGTKQPWGLFPAVSLGWRITQESFMQHQKIFDNLKLRVGYGVTGSEPSQSFLGVATLGYNHYVYSNGKWIQTLVPTSNPNPNLRWEQKKELDLGLDFGMLNDRVSGSVDLYNRTIDNLLYDYPVPSPPNLYNHTIANVGKMRNKGIEVMLNFVPVKSSDFQWTSSISYSTNQNRLVSLSNDIYKLSTNYLTIGYTGPPVQTFTHLLRVGGRVGDFYGFKVIGVDNNKSDPANYGQWIYEGTKADGHPGQAIKYSDFNHSFEDKQVIGNGVPKFYAGWNNTFRYKNWDLSITQRGAFGFQIANFQRMFMENPTYTQYNLLKSAFKKIDGVLLKSPLEFNSHYIENGDYWKIDNITLGYTIPTNKIKFISSARIYVTSLNTFIITGYSGVDPEVSQLNPPVSAQSGINVVTTSGLDPGIDRRYTYPTTRTFTFGIDLKF